MAEQQQADAAFTLDKLDAYLRDKLADGERFVRIGDVFKVIARPVAERDGATQ